jgi:DNA polymerase-3 subunit alpha
MCNVELSLGKPELPDFKLPDGCQEDLPGYLRKVARKGLEERFGELTAARPAFDPDCTASASTTSSTSSCR